MQQCMYLFRENMPIYVSISLYENVNKKSIKLKKKSLLTVSSVAFSTLLCPP